MITSRSRKWIAWLVGVLALVLLTGAGTAWASQTHHGPATSAPSYTQAVHTVSQIGQWRAGLTASRTEQERTFTGIVQSINQSKQTFRFLPSGQTTAVTIAYDARTGIQNTHWTMQGSRGMEVFVHVMTLRDGSWYATGIEPVMAHGKSGPASVQSGSAPTWRDGPCGWRDHYGSGDYHH